MNISRCSHELIHQAILPAWWHHVVAVLCMCKFYAHSCHFFVNWAIRLWCVLHGVEYVQQDCGHCNAYNRCEQQSRDLDWWLYWRTLDGNRLMLVFSLPDMEPRLLQLWWGVCSYQLLPPWTSKFFYPQSSTFAHLISWLVQQSNIYLCLSRTCSTHLDDEILLQVFPHHQMHHQYSNCLFQRAMYPGTKTDLLAKLLACLATIIYYFETRFYWKLGSSDWIFFFIDTRSMMQ
jgi:hypothetical protein